jgi:chromosome segregation ATPase
MTSEFNAIDYTNELESTGVPKDQASVHAKALSRVLADVAFARDLVTLEGNVSKQIRECEERMILRIDSMRTDLVARIDMVRTQLDAKIEAVKIELGARLTTMEAELRAEIAAIRAEIGSVRAEIGSVRAEINSVRNELVLHRWVFGIVIALSTANLALTVRLLLP